MSDGVKTVRGAFELGVGEALGFAAGFARFLILARVLSKTDFGIAATIALTVQTLQTISNMALNILIVQSKSGDDRALGATVHSVQVIRGVAGAALILAFAPVISGLFGIPEALWVFRLLALAPLLEGFVNLDTFRMERDMRFRPSITVIVAPKILAALVAWPMAVWIKDYSAMLWLMLLQGAATVLMSHFMARRRYALAWNSAFLNEILRFGWPLLFNGLLLLGVFQGDRLIIGAMYTMDDLAVYSVAAGLVMALSGALFKVVHTVMLPRLARAQHEGGEFARRYLSCTVLFAVMAALYGSALMIAGEPLVVFVYGGQYRAAGILVTWLAAAQSIRIIRLGPSLAAMARGDTKCLMYANIFRLSGVAAAVGAAVAGADMRWIAAAAFAGEAIAFPIPLIRLSRRHGLNAGICLRPAAAAAVCLIMAAAVLALGLRDVFLTGLIVATLVTAVGLILWASLAYSSFRKWILSLADML